MSGYPNPVLVREDTSEGVAPAAWVHPALSSDGSQWILTTTVNAVLTGGAAPTVTGAKGANVALGSLIAALAGLGLITDATTA